MCSSDLFHSILYTKLFSVLLLALSCLGTKGVKGEKITWGRIWTAFAVGFVLFFLNWWLLPLPLPLEAVTGLYVLTIGTGYVCLLMGGLWMSRLLKHNLMEDVFNNENESFMQETRLIESEYSEGLASARRRPRPARPKSVRRPPLPWRRRTPSPPCPGAALKIGRAHV